MGTYKGGCRGSRMPLVGTAEYTHDTASIRLSILLFAMKIQLTECFCFCF